MAAVTAPEKDDSLVDFTIGGEPVAWMRAKRGRHSSYTDPKVVAAKKDLADSARAAMLGRATDESSDIGIELRFSCCDRAGKDLDNYTKLVLDALNGVVWHDDVQITRIIAHIYEWEDGDATKPHTLVSVWVESPGPTCHHCAKPLPFKFRRMPGRRFCDRECWTLYYGDLRKDAGRG